MKCLRFKARGTARACLFVQGIKKCIKKQTPWGEGRGRGDHGRRGRGHLWLRGGRGAEGRGGCPAQRLPARQVALERGLGR